MNEDLLFKMMIESGCVCMDMGEFHKRAESLVGHPIWTHEFADESLWLDMKVKLLTNHKSDREHSPVYTLLEMIT